MKENRFNRNELWLSVFLLTFFIHYLLQAEQVAAIIQYVTSLRCIQALKDVHCHYFFFFLFVLPVINLWRLRPAGR